MLTGGLWDYNDIALRLTAVSEGDFESLSHRWFSDMSGSKPTIIAKKREYLFLNAALGAAASIIT